ncbi:MAG: enoyl-CoA hydratase/isomerase family protein [Hyphomicrobiaceae bacterium]
MPLLVRQATPHVVLVTIDNQAKRNAMSRAMLAELAALWDRLATDDACRAVVITGAGEKGFCAGADIGGDLTASPELAAMINRSLLKTSVFPKPIIAAVNGDCAGGGVELLLATDIRAAAPHARFGLPEVRFAIYPFGGATVKLIQQIGYVHAMDLILTGRLVDAQTAARLALVNEVVPAPELLDWALGKAAAIAANSPAAVQAVKTQISSTIADHAQSREALDQKLGDTVRASADFNEGVAAFLEKRKPEYR